MSFISGIYEQQYRYKSFLPHSIQQDIKVEDPMILSLLEEASHYLGALNAFSELVPNIDFFITMLATQEATSSSRIEGTQTGIEEAVLSEEDISPERRDDWREVQNYIKAMNCAIQRLESLPLSIRLLKEAHSVLLSGVRGENKLPGEIRRSQNWIGGSNLNNAFFIPPSHERLGELLSDLEKFWHEDQKVLPYLIKIALTHYQFETIHPFLDGNGRIGRMLITLQLISAGILSRPCLYVSSFFEKNRMAYYDSLSYVRESSHIDQWLKFFLSAISYAASQGQESLKKILSVRESSEEKINTLGAKVRRGHKLLRYLFSKPIVSIKETQAYLDIKYDAANNLIADFQRLGILQETTGNLRNRLFLYGDYIDIFKKNEEASWS